jgi:hypothetical protein
LFYLLLLDPITQRLSTLYAPGTPSSDALRTEKKILALLVFFRTTDDRIFKKTLSGTYAVYYFTVLSIMSKISLLSRLTCTVTVFSLTDYLHQTTPDHSLLLSRLSRENPAFKA